MPENDLAVAHQEAAAQAAHRRTAQDQRTRIARRVRSVENQLRAQLRRRGRTISIDDDLSIGQIAQAQVRIEATRAQQSRGLEVDDMALARLINISQRGLAKLGLRPTLLDAGLAPRGLSIARERWNRAATTTEATGEYPDDDRRTAE
jgi:hypothetical protein